MSFWINGELLKQELYPNNEVRFDGKQISGILSSSAEEVKIRWRYETDVDFIRLKFLTNHLVYERGDDLDLFLQIDYMPYSRMDRVQTEDQIFSLKWAADFINDLPFSCVAVVEPHSDVTPALLDHVRVYSPAWQLLGAAYDYWRCAPDVRRVGPGMPTLVFPDAGAQKRYMGDPIERINAFGPFSEFPVMSGSKLRDFATGRFTKFELNGPLPATSLSTPFFILDDLCSYGGTFLKTAEAIRNRAWRGPIYLVVTHCEDSVFNGTLLRADSPIDHIFTTDSMRHTAESPKISVSPLGTVWGEAIHQFDGGNR